LSELALPAQRVRDRAISALFAERREQNLASSLHDRAPAHTVETRDPVVLFRFGELQLQAVSVRSITVPELMVRLCRQRRKACALDSFSVIANTASIVGLLVSASAWLKVFALRKQFITETRMIELLKKAEWAHREMEAVIVNAPTSPENLVRAATLGKEAVLQIEAAARWMPAKANATIVIGDALRDVCARLTPANRDYQNIGEAVGTIKLLCKQIENYIDEWKRR
jgi:hypothetical protein